MGEAVKATSLKFGTEQGDITYLVSDDERFLENTIVVEPSNAFIDYQYELTVPTGVEFITKVNQVSGLPKIRIYTTTPSSDVFEVKFKVTESFSKVFVEEEFYVTISCVRSITEGSVASQTYYINDVFKDIPIPDATLDPALCPYELTYIVRDDQGVDLPFMTQAQLDADEQLVAPVTYVYNKSENKHFLRVYETNYGSTADFKVRVTFTDPKTSVLNNKLLIDIKILCTKTLDIDSSTKINSFNYQISYNNPVTTYKLLPSYTQNPSGCAVGTITRELVFTGTGTAPTFISIVDVQTEGITVQNVKVATQDPANAGSYDFKIKATDSLTDVSNQENAFTVTVLAPILATDFKLSSGEQSIADTTHTLSPDKSLINVPKYDVVPSDANFKFSVALDINKSFISVVEDSGTFTIQIDTNDKADTGAYTIKVTVTEEYSGLTKESTFILTVSCVTTITKGTTPNALDYWINDDAKPLNLPSYTFDRDCPNELEYSAKQLKADGSLSPLPSTITLKYDSSADVHYLEVDQQNNFLVTGEYTIVITVVDPYSLVENSELQVQVKIHCMKTIGVKSGSFTDLSYQIVWSEPATLTHPMPVFEPNPTSCIDFGTISLELIYTDSGAAPEFIEQTADDEIKVSTQDDLLVGTYNFKIKATDSITKIYSDTFTFPIYVLAPGLCTDLVLTESSQLANGTTYLVGSVLDSETLFNLPTYTLVPADADVSLNFTVNSDSLPDFIQVVNTGKGLTGQQLQVKTTDATFTNEYEVVITLTDSFTQKTRWTKFQLIVQCVQSISLDNSYTIDQQTYYIGDAKSTFVLPLHKLTPIACPYELTYSAKLSDGTALPNAITLQQSNDTHHELQFLETTQSAVGKYIVSITVTDPKTGKQNTQMEVNVDVLCVKRLEIDQNSIAAITSYTIDITTAYTMPLEIPSYKSFPDGCDISSFTYTYEVQSEVTPFPSFITQKPTTAINISTKEPSDAETYSFKLLTTGTLSSWTWTNDLVEFDVVLIKITDLSLIEGTKITDQVQRINDQARIIAVPRYSPVTFPTPASVTTEFTYSLISPTPSFVTLEGSGDETSQVKIEPTSFADANKPFEVKIQVVEKYSQITKTYSFNLLVTCVDTITLKGAFSNVTYYIGDTTSQYLNVPEYTVTASCPIALKFTVERTDAGIMPAAISADLTATYGNHLLTVQSTDTSSQGTYKLDIIAIDKFSLVKSAVANIWVFIRIRATDFVIDSGTSIGDQTYQIGVDTQKLITVPTYSKVPSNADIHHWYKEATGSPSFVGMHGDWYGMPKIKIDTTSVANAGKYEITLVYTDDYSGLKRYEKFNLTVTCITSLTAPTLTDVDYYMTEAKITITPVFTPNKVGNDFCPTTTVSLTMMQASGDPLPASIRSSSTQLFVEENSFQEASSYEIKIIAKDSLTNVTKETTLKVNLYCVKEVHLVSGKINDFGYGAVYSYLKTDKKALPKYEARPTGCSKDALTYELVYNVANADFPNVINQYPTTELLIATQDENMVGDYDFTLVCTEPKSGKQNKDDSFTLTIGAPTLADSITFVDSSKVDDFVFWLGGPDVVVGPYEYTVNPSYADVTITFSLSADSPSFASLVPQETGAPKIKISTNDPAEIGKHDVTFVLTDALGKKTEISDIFTVDVQEYVITATSTETFNAVLNATPDITFNIDASSKFTTSLDGNADFPDQQKDSLSYEFVGCVDPTSGSQVSLATTNKCCDMLFNWDGVKNLSKANALADKFCDGEYTVKIKAKQASFPDVSAIYSAKVVVKYDCLSLVNAGLYSVPTASLVKWPNKVKSLETQSSKVSFTIEDPATDFTHPLIHPAQTYTYSCSVQYEFVCPSGQSYCTELSSFFSTPTQISTAMLNDAMWTDYPLGTQLRSLATTSHYAKHLLDGKLIQMNAYVFSTDVIASVAYDALNQPSNTPQYGGNINYVGSPLTWTYEISITKNCLASFISLVEKSSDPNAQVSSALKASEIVQSPLASRTKLVQRMDLANQYDSKYCLADFDKFVLRSKQLSDNFASIFSFTDSGSSASNSKVTLIAAANELVNSPTCKLSTKTQIAAGMPASAIKYKESCDFVLQVESFIGNKSFGTYTSFTYTVVNECLNFDPSKPQPNMWTFKPYVKEDPIQPLDPVILRNQLYTIWFDADSKSLALPRLSVSLASELLGQGYSSAANECGPTTYSVTNQEELSSVATIENGGQYPILTILSHKSSDGGSTILTNYKRSYSVEMQATFTKWPTLDNFKYNITKTASQPDLSFDMSDRCLGMYYLPPNVTYNEMLATGGSIDVKYAQNDESTWAKYLTSKTGMVISVDRFEPMLFRTDPNMKEEAANGRCGTFTYKPTLDGSQVQLTWSDTQINPKTISSEPLKLNVFTSETSMVGMHSFSITAIPSIKTYQSQTMDFKYEVLPTTYCGLSFIKSEVVPTSYKYYLEPYNTVPDDLVRWGSEITAPIPGTQTYCPQNQVIYSVSSTRQSMSTSEDLVKQGCVSVNSKAVVIETSCLNNFKPGTFKIEVGIKDAANKTVADDILFMNLEIALTPMPVIPTSAPPVSEQEKIKIPDEPMPALLLRWQPPAPKSSTKWVPPLMIFVDKVTSDGVLQMQFNRAVGFNLDFFENIAQMQGVTGIEKPSNSKRQMLAKTSGAQIAAEETAFLYSVIDNAFDIKYMPADPNYATILLQYQTIAFEDYTKIEIQLNFEDPLLVSYHSTQTSNAGEDKLYVSLKNAQTFQDPTNGSVLENSLMSNFEYSVPKQIPKNLASTMEVATKSIQTMSQSAGWILLLNLLVGVGLKYLWKAVNILQFVVYTGNWNLSPPSNLKIFFFQAAFFARGDWIPKDKILDFLHFNSKSNQTQQTKFLLIIGGAVILVLVVLFAIIYAFRRIWCCNKVVHYAYQQRDWMIWNGFIRTILQMYLDFAVSVGIVYMVPGLKPASMKMIGIYICTFILVGLIVTLCVVINQWFKNGLINNSYINRKFGSLWLDLRINSQPAVNYYVVFLFRRFVFAIVASIVGPKFGGLSLVLAIYISLLFQVLYLNPIKPNEDPIDQLVEAFSECFLHYFFYGVMLEETFDDPRTKFNMGWWSVACVALILLIFSVLIAWRTAKDYYRIARLQYYKFIHMLENPDEILEEKPKVERKKKQKAKVSILDQSDRKSLFVIPEAEPNAENDSEAVEVRKSPELPPVAELPEPDETPGHELKTNRWLKSTRGVLNDMYSGRNADSSRELQQRERVVSLDDMPSRLASRVISLDDMPSAPPAKLISLDDMPDRPTQLVSMDDMVKPKPLFGGQLNKESEAVQLATKIMMLKAFNEGKEIEDIEANIPVTPMTVLDQSYKQSPNRKTKSLRDLTIEPYRQEAKMRTSNVSIGDESYRDSARTPDKVSDISPRKYQILSPESPAVTPRESRLQMGTPRTDFGPDQNVHDDLQTKFELVSPRSFTNTPKRLSPVPEREIEEEKHDFLTNTRKLISKIKTGPVGKIPLEVNTIMNDRSADVLQEKIRTYAPNHDSVVNLHNPSANHSDFKDYPVSDDLTALAMAEYNKIEPSQPKEGFNDKEYRENSNLKKLITRNNIEVEWKERAPNGNAKFLGMWERLQQLQPEQPQRWAVDADPQIKEVRSAPSNHGDDQSSMTLPLSPAELERRKLYEKEMNTTQKQHADRMHNARAGLEALKQANRVKKVNGSVKAIFLNEDKKQSNL